MSILLRKLCAAMLFVCGSAAAATVTYQANNLADANVGEDLWEYRYNIGGTFNQFDVIEITFDSLKYAALDGDAQVGDWDILITQPDAILGDGLYEAIASIDNPSTTDEFVVRFVWLGGAATPGQQGFRLLSGDFEVLQTGNTHAEGTPTVPEPASMILFLAAGIAMASVMRRKKGK
jgi:hypothetical protein